MKILERERVIEFTDLCALSEEDTKDPFVPAKAIFYIPDYQEVVAVSIFDTQNMEPAQRRRFEELQRQELCRQVFLIPPSQRHAYYFITTVRVGERPFFVGKCVTHLQLGDCIPPER